MHIHVLTSIRIDFSPPPSLRYLRSLPIPLLLTPPRRPIFFFLFLPISLPISLHTSPPYIPLYPSIYASLNPSLHLSLSLYSPPYILLYILPSIPPYIPLPILLLPTSLLIPIFISPLYIFPSIPPYIPLYPSIYASLNPYTLSLYILPSIPPYIPSTSLLISRLKCNFYLFLCNLPLVL
ncbi:unnamed protein product [Meloidogyne enterolobii]|uniref:Uncharacterized protein n=1 Tax=Meloidogyne enterolobii TaxID=390850 RepID=A0ACB1B584_MELEN